MGRARRSPCARCSCEYARVPRMSRHRDARGQPMWSLLDSPRPDGRQDMSAASNKLPRSASPPNLETRVAIRKQALIAELVEHKKNSSRAGAAEAVDKIKAHLLELAQIVKVGVVDGWAHVSPNAAVKLDA